MGTWNFRLYGNDTTADVKETYIGFLKQQLNNTDAYLKTLEEYDELMGTDEESLFWYALADTQWNVGRLTEDVRDKAIAFIKAGSDDMLENPRWEVTFQKLKDKLESPMPAEKRFAKPIEFVRNPWNIGDIYAYQFHTEEAVEHDLYGKYILFQKIGNIEYYENMTFSAIQVFDRVFEEIPDLDMVKDIRILPLTHAPGKNGAPNSISDYIPSFEWNMKATMIYEKKLHYPKKHFTFVGNVNVQEITCESNELCDYFFSKNGMEDWLIKFYLSWQNVEY